MHLPKGQGHRFEISGGVELEWKITKEMSRGAYVVFIQTNPPGMGVPMHIHHTDEENIYLLEGELLFQLGDDVFTVRPGDFVNMPRGMPHGFKTIGDVPTRVIFTLDLAPESDYEGMFARLMELDPNDDDGLLAAAAANNCEFMEPLLLPERQDH